jgi:hypothetical protein
MGTYAKDAFCFSLVRSRWTFSVFRSISEITLLGLLVFVAQNRCVPVSCVVTDIENGNTQCAGWRVRCVCNECMHLCGEFWAQRHDLTCGSSALGQQAPVLLSAARASQPPPSICLRLPPPPCPPICFTAIRLRGPFQLKAPSNGRPPPPDPPPPFTSSLSFLLLSSPESAASGGRPAGRQPGSQAERGTPVTQLVHHTRKGEIEPRKKRVLLVGSNKSCW